MKLDELLDRVHRLTRTTYQGTPGKWMGMAVPIMDDLARRLKLAVEAMKECKDHSNAYGGECHEMETTIQEIEDGPKQ